MKTYFLKQLFHIAQIYVFLQTFSLFFIRSKYIRNHLQYSLEFLIKGSKVLLNNSILIEKWLMPHITNNAQ